MRRVLVTPSLFALLTLKEPEFAWNLAHSLVLDSDHTWSELGKVYEKIDPIATLPIHKRLVENELVEAGAQHYRNRCSAAETPSRAPRYATC